jgi:hypothetical protein
MDDFGWRAVVMAIAIGAMAAAGSSLGIIQLFHLHV